MIWILGIVAGIVIISIILYNFAFIGFSQKKSRDDYHSSRDRDIKPVTRHPHVDHSICILCGSCIRACPETHGDDSPLGIVEGRLLLINPAKCVGHGECEIQCPTGAMTVSLGELADDPSMPILTDDFESVIPGIFIAGELSGVPLVKNAIEQGAKVIYSIAEKIKTPAPLTSEIYDVVIVGLGPAGLSASLAAHEKNLRYVTIEQKDIGGTVANFPKQKMVMTSPVHLPLYGMLKKSEIQKEELIEIWNTMVDKYKLNLHIGEKVEGIFSENELFSITTVTRTFKTRNIVLCLGRRGTPRKLGVPGEDLTKVTYGLIDPDAYLNKNILVVGGGDSAIEAAIELSKDNNITLSYRNESFFRIKEKNGKKINDLEKSGKVKIMFESSVKSVLEDKVFLTWKDNNIEIDNDYVFVLIGGEPAYPLLRSIGVLRK
jgi:thioredoxin reductase